MGRYAFFNTDFEYKFGLGVQDSRDILEFGGKLIDVCGIIQWTQNDKEFILDELNIDKSFFDKYEKNVSGTWKLYGIREDNYKEILGCVIYHQLLYMDVLECEFEW